MVWLFVTIFCTFAFIVLFIIVLYKSTMNQHAISAIVLSMLLVLVVACMSSYFAGFEKGSGIVHNNLVKQNDSLNVFTFKMLRVDTCLSRYMNDSVVSGGFLFECKEFFEITFKDIEK